jgi:hypothetical protein
MDGTDIIFALAGLTDETTMWMFYKINVAWAAASAPNAGPRIMEWDGSLGSMGIEYSPTTSQWVAWREQGGLENDAVSAGQTFTAGSTDLSIMVAYETTRSGMSVNGGAFAWQTDATQRIAVIDGTTFMIGNRSDGARPLVGDFYWAAGGLGALPSPDANAATMHAFGNTEPTWSSIPASPSWLWAAADITYLDTAPSSASFQPPPRRQNMGQLLQL